MIAFFPLFSGETFLNKVFTFNIVPESRKMGRTVSGHRDGNSSFFLLVKQDYNWLMDAGWRYYSPLIIIILIAKLSETEPF